MFLKKKANKIIFIYRMANVTTELKIEFRGC